MTPDWRRVLREFAPWEDFPENRDAAVKRVEVHLSHRRTSVTRIWTNETTGGPATFRIHFADGTSMWGQFGFVVHGVRGEDVPGAEIDHTGWRRFYLPVNRIVGAARHAEAGSSQPLHCGVRQPAGAECFICGARVE
jgi:hypothetical protein